MNAKFLTIPVLLLFIAVSSRSYALDRIVRSCYRDESINAEKCTDWTFSDSGQIVLVRPDKAKGASVIIEKTKDGHEVTDIKVMDDKRKKTASPKKETQRVFLSDGHPAPFDWVRPDNKGAEDVRVEKTAGGVVFADFYRKEVEPFTEKDAIEKGWINEDNRSFVIPARKFSLIKIIKESDIVLLQLWQEGADFWLYEESGIRKSRRIR